MAKRRNPRAAPRTEPSVAPDWSRGRHALAALGPRTEQALVAAIRSDPQFSPLAKLEDEDLEQIAAALTGWSDREAARVIQSYDRHPESGRNVDVRTFCRWLRQHPSDADAVAECLAVAAPEGVSLIRLLSRPGRPKRVFLASWELTQKEIVLEQRIGPAERQQAIFDPEARTRPLATGHPNVIETHPLTNADGQSFLAEEYVPVVLSDRWESGGLQEAANLLHDVCKALAYLHGERRLVHGDVKPDNIGSRDGTYILLHFGNCRPISEAARERIGAGSVRTRAPELFAAGPLADPTKADVWAAAATVFRTVTGRFPFLDPEEEVPKTSTFEKEVARRIAQEWDRRVNLKEVPEPLRAVLAAALVRDPTERATAEAVVNLCEKHLAGFLRSGPGGGHLTAEEELRQLLDFLPRDGSLALMPLATKQVMKARLNAFRRSMALSGEDSRGVEGVLAALGD